jgi:hypothetical protein
MLEFSKAPVWTENRIDQLEDDEHDFQEYKSSFYVADGREINSHFLLTMSKQVSAFANGAGGTVFLGIDDSGEIDGGIRTDLKGGGTRAWLEDVIHDLVTPRLARFNVFEVLGEGGGSRIMDGHAVYVVDIPESSEAPHQARDHRYYLRIAGKSRPMGHVHVQDVLRRTRNTRLAMTRMGPYGEPELDDSDARGRRVFVGFRILVSNISQTLAHHVGAELILPRHLVGAEVRRRILLPGDIHHTQRPGEVAFFRYHPNPVFPSQELFFLMFWVGIHANNQEAIRAGATVKWRLYADDASPVEGEEVLWRFAAIRKAVQMLLRPAATG